MKLILDKAFLEILNIFKQTYTFNIIIVITIPKLMFGGCGWLNWYNVYTGLPA